MAAALDQIEKQQVDLTGLIAKRYFLNDALAAFEHAAAPGALKILFQMTPKPFDPIPAEEERRIEHPGESGHGYS